MPSTPKREYLIPADTEAIFVQDFFPEEFLGGAELTSEAFIHHSPYRVFKLHASSLTPQMLQEHRDKIWIFGNFQSVNLSLLGLALNLKLRLYMIEYDYKFCDFRLPQLHQFQRNSPCDCHTRERGRFIAKLFKEARKSFFMSEKQMQVYGELFPSAKPNGVALSSAWVKEDLEYLRTLRACRVSNGRWAILKRDSFVKNQTGTEAYARAHGISYDLVGEMPYREFLRILSSYDGLLFHPAGYDSCPRLTIEAKLMGMQLLLNEHVQHKEEPWFNQNVSSIEEYLLEIPHRLWRIIEATG
jgi:hypothetical protein